MMSDSKQPPIFIQTAQKVLARSDIESLADFKAIKKGLTVLAAKMNQSGQDVSEQYLYEIALKGAEHVKELCDGFDFKSKPTYEDIIKKLLAPPMQETLHEKLIRCSTEGDLSGVKSAIKAGADSNREDKNNKRAITQAALNGHLPIIKYLIHEGKDLEFFQKDQVFRYACFGAHLDVMKFALDKGLGIDNKFECIKIVAGNGNIDCWNFLMGNGFDKFLSKINIEYANRKYYQSSNAKTPTSILNYAAHMGQYDMVKLLLEYGIKPNKNTLINAVAANPSKYEQLEMVKTLFEHGALISKSAMKVAVENCRLRTFQYLTNELKARNQGKADEAYPGKDWLSEEDFEFMEQLEEWSKITQSEPFRYCCDLNPQLWKNRDVRDRTDFIVKLLEKEGFKSHINITMAFPAALLFEDDQSLFRYLKKHGQVGKQPLHDIIYMLRLPRCIEKIQWDAWRGAIMMHGPKMAKLLKFADKVTPVRSSCGKNWLYNETLNEIALHAYKNAEENVELAALLLSHAYDDNDFQDALSLTKEFNKTAKKSNIPDIEFKLPNGMIYKKLPDGDIRGLVLGEFTNCCQSINGAGDKCARHGYISENGGFYVVLDSKGEIIGQSWAWIGEGNELVLDSLETLGDRIASVQWRNIIKRLAKNIDKSAPNIRALHVGKGGKTPKLDFKHKSVEPKDYKGYRDSIYQYLIWKR